MRHLLILVFFSLSVNLFGQEKEIRDIMKSQEDCWNKGDLDCFMQGYWKSDELVFVGSGGPRYGWQVTLNGYKRSYPNKEAMGKIGRAHV